MCVFIVDTKFISLTVTQVKNKNLEHYQAFIVVTEKYFSKSQWTRSEGLVVVHNDFTYFKKNVSKTVD